MSESNNVIKGSIGARCRESERAQHPEITIPEGGNRRDRGLTLECTGIAFSGLKKLSKRIEDIVLSTLILFAVSPIMVMVAIGVKLSSPGPVICRQWRNGLAGKRFEMYKFRTMTCCDDGFTLQQTFNADPRRTRFGKWLRKTSSDELPQLINVLQGRMSIVGPRPHTVAMNEEYRKLVPGYAFRHKVKPGITGLAQANGWIGPTDSLEKMEKRIAYDLKYIEEWSLLLDLKIIALTILKGAWWREEK